VAVNLPPVARRAIGATLLLVLLGVPAIIGWLYRPSERSGAPTDAGATRVVSLVPAVTEMIFAVGGGDRLVGVSSFDTYPPDVQRITRVGGLLDPDLERIFALEPDLVVIYGSQDDLRSQLQRAGIAAFVYRHGSLDDVVTTIREIGARLGLREQADRKAAEIERGLDAIRARVAGLPRPRTLLVIGRERGALRAIYASGGRGFLHELLDVAGGADALADVDRENVQASTELILGLSPEVIVELQGDELTPEEVERERQVWNALPGLPAVQRGRVHILSGQELVVPGPRVVGAAERLARALHPERERRTQP
jgi:iron complex transport system substrate-binding protein